MRPCCLALHAHTPTRTRMHAHARTHAHPPGRCPLARPRAHLPAAFGRALPRATPRHATPCSHAPRHPGTHAPTHPRTTHDDGRAVPFILSGHPLPTGSRLPMKFDRRNLIKKTELPCKQVGFLPCSPCELAGSPRVS